MPLKGGADTIAAGVPARGDVGLERGDGGDGAVGQDLGNRRAHVADHVLGPGQAPFAAHLHDEIRVAPGDEDQADAVAVRLDPVIEARAILIAAAEEGSIEIDSMHFSPVLKGEGSIADHVFWSCKG